MGQWRSSWRSDQQSLDLALDGLDLFLEFLGLVGGDRACDHRSRDPTGSTECGLGGYEDVRDVLILTE